MTFADHIRAAFRRVKCEEKLIENIIENMRQDRKADIWSVALLDIEKEPTNEKHSAALLRLWEHAKKMLCTLTSAK